ncbi:MAG: ferrous iron transport protein B [Spirochaetes bacterium]|nr:ferrous iron transport protein B [Spirochaetota bacterium]
MQTDKIIRAGLVGNPNCGKTTIFNALTGLHQRTANWSGVTIEKKEGIARFGELTIKIVDLPGIYSLSAYSLEEIIARNYIIHEQPDVIVNIVDAGNLERNLYLTAQLINIGVRVILVLNMYDEAQDQGIEYDTEKMSLLLGMPVVKTVGTKGEGIRELLSTIVAVATNIEKNIRSIQINYGEDIETEIKQIQNKIEKERTIGMRYSTRWLALRLLENDTDVFEKLRPYPNYGDIVQQAKISREIIEKKYGDEIEIIMAERRQGFVTGLLKEVTLRIKESKPDISERIDKIVMNKYFGYPILLFLLWVLFQSTYVLGEYPRNLIEKSVHGLIAIVTAILPDGFAKRLLTEGILAGVGGVVVFLPNILILFLGISFLEDTGYMARAAFIMDKIMHKLGLHGKSFIPLVMGFGCNVPAIMATRSLENTRDRIITVLVNPFMSCSARLPVYVLFASVFFQQYAGTVILSLYFVGMIMAFISSKIFHILFFKTKTAPFVMELPPYRLPTVRAILLHMWNRSSQYLRKMSGIILLLSIIVWLLCEFPQHNDSQLAFPNEHSSPAITRQDMNANNQLASTQRALANSYMGKIGSTIAPLLEPLGFTWQMSVALLTGIVAKEVVISTLNIFYMENRMYTSHSRPPDLDAALKSDFAITPLIAYVYMLFVLLYIPCVATSVAIGREIGWQWAFFSIAYNLILTWIVCFLVYRIGLLIT